MISSIFEERLVCKGAALCVKHAPKGSQRLARCFVRWYDDNYGPDSRQELARVAEMVVGCQRKVLAGTKAHPLTAGSAVERQNVLKVAFWERVGVLAGSGT